MGYNPHLQHQSGLRALGSAGKMGPLGSGMGKQRDVHKLSSFQLTWIESILIRDWQQVPGMVNMQKGRSLATLRAACIAALLELFNWPGPA